MCMCMPDVCRYKQSELYHMQKKYKEGIKRVNNFFFLFPLLSHAKTNMYYYQEIKRTSRTQDKLLLQRQSFLADDKNYLNHPDNMKRLTKELERMNKEYRHLKQFCDPFTMSLKRILLNNNKK